MCFVNKLDRTGADFYRCVDMIVDRLNSTPLVLQIPIGAESDFIGVVDLVGMRALTWRGETKMGEDYEVEEIPAEMAEQAAEWREKLLETLAEADDAVMEKYSRARSSRSRRSRPRSVAPPSPTSSTRSSPAPRSRTRASSRCSTRSSKYLPSPLDVEAIEGHKVNDEETIIKRRPSEDEPFAGLAFKIADPAPGQADLRPRLLRQAEAASSC